MTPLDLSTTAQPESAAASEGDDARVTPEELAAVRAQLAQIAAWQSDELVEKRDGLTPGRIGRFRIQEQLGSGSFGTVYVAYDPQMSRNVAIKVAHDTISVDEFKRKRFKAEAEAAARLGHPNIVTVHEYGQEAGYLYIVYQLCVGPTLADWMAGLPDRIDPRVAVEIVRQLAQGLSHAHANGIVHRDVKPGNIVLQEADDAARLAESCPISFIPRITDFGLAHNQRAVENISQEDSFVGTIDYMSPEQVLGSKASQLATTDIYSLGVLLYRMLTGVLPCKGEDTLDTLRHIGSVEPLSPRYLCSKISPDLAAICLKCLAKQPRERYSSCESLIDDLDHWRSGDAVSALPRSAIQHAVHAVRRAPNVSALVLAVALICMLSGLGLGYMLTELRNSNAQLLQMLDTAQANGRRAAQAITEKDAALLQVAAQRDQVYQQFLSKLDASYRADMHLAYQDLDAGRVVSVRKSLDRIERALGGHRKPGFEFDLLRAYVARTSRQLSGHARSASDLVVIPDTRLVASCGDDGFVLFQDALTGEVKQRFCAEKNWTPTSLAISRDGRRLAIGWRVSFAFAEEAPFSLVAAYEFDCSKAEGWVGPELCMLPATTTIQSMCFSPEGQRLAFGPRYGSVVLVDLQTMENRPFETKSRNRSLEFSPDGQQLLVLQADACATILDAMSGELVAEVAPQRVPQIASWSPDGKWVAFAEYGSSQVCMVAVKRPHRIAAYFEQHNNVIETLSFDPNCQRLLAGTRAGSIVAWSLRDVHHAQPEVVHDTTPHSGIVTALKVVRMETQGVGVDWAVSVDDLGQVLATPLATIEVGETGLASERPLVIRLLQDQRSTARRALRPAHESQMLAGYVDGSLKLVRHDGQPVKTLVDNCGSEVSAIANSPDGRWAAAGWEDGRIVLIDLYSSGAIRECRYLPPSDSLDERRINAIQFSADGHHFAACGDDARLRVWAVADCSQPTCEMVHTSLAYSLCFVDKQRIACGGMFEEVHVYDLETGDLVAKLAGTSRAKTLMFDAARKFLVSGHDDGHIRIHDTRDWRLQNSLVESVDSITSLCLSPCRTCYLAGNERGGLSLWNADAQIYIGKLPCSGTHCPVESIEICNAKCLFVLTRPGQHPQINRIGLTSQVAHR